MSFFTDRQIIAQEAQEIIRDWGCKTIIISSPDGNGKLYKLTADGGSVVYLATDGHLIISEGNENHPLANYGTAVVEG